jgi:hypothetical protein
VFNVGQSEEGEDGWRVDLGFAGEQNEADALPRYVPRIKMQRYSKNTLD